MSSLKISTCIKDSCQRCDIQARTNCKFKLFQLFFFYSISLPAFFVGGIFMHAYYTAALYIWLVILIIFFMFVEIRVLCTHCPHYDRSSYFLTCWANYGAPKLWKYRPGPMSKMEKAVLIIGFIVVWGYPVIFFLLSRNMAVLSLYLILVFLFFAILGKKNCTQCINFSCPLNRVDNQTKAVFFENNPYIYKHWKQHLEK